LIAIVSSLPFYSFAQGDAAPIKKSRAYTMAPDKGAFILYAGPNGEMLCRQATPAEAVSMGGARNGLVQINHLDKGPTSESTTAGLTIILRATPQLLLPENDAAEQAFIAAADKWEALIQDPITIAIDVDYGTKFFDEDFSGPTVIGATRSPQFFSPNNYPDIRNRLVNHAPVGSAERTLANALPTGTVPTDIGSVNTVLVTGPLLRALGSFQPNYNDDNPVRTAPQIGFNSAFGFDFDPSDGITGNRTDFDAVAVHEMGHALGFNSQVGARELDPTEDLAVTIWDLFRFRPATANLGNFATAQRILSSGGTQVQFNGGAELGLSTGKPDGSPGGDEEQASHWKADEQSGTYIGIMDPTITRNVREVMTAADQSTIDYFGYTTTPTAAPPNDNFVNAQIVTGNSGTVTGTNAFATKETGEPDHSPDGEPSGKSIWYRWTAPNSGTVTMTTVGSNYDTLLAIYGGTSVCALGAPIAANDDENNPGGILTSRVQFSAVGGTTYQITVDGYGGDQGDVTLNWSLPVGPSPSPSPILGGPNTVQFVVGTASVTETPNANTKVDLTVTRTGTTTGAATVNYATSDGTAKDRSDYIAALGTLRFAANEETKTVTVLIVDDSYGEDPETFNLALSAPVGCTLGATPAVVVTINSNSGETVPGTNGPNPVKDPNFSSDFFVRQHYFDFLNRAPDDGGLAFWKNQIDECTTDQCRLERRINVSAAFFLSIEFQETGYLVERLYKTAYGDATATSRHPDGVARPIQVPIVRLNEFLSDSQEIGRGVVIGLPGWPELLESKKQAFIAEFVQRPRFTTSLPSSMTPTEFVDKLNINAGNPLSTSERQTLIDGLTNSTKTRAQVLREVADDADLFAAEKNRAFVLVQYFGYLRRNPDDPQDTDHSGYDFWLGKLNQFNGNFVAAQMVIAFLDSNEYKRRFGPD